MKWKYLILLLITVQSCRNQNTEQRDLQDSVSDRSKKFDSLTNRLQNGYYPNFHSVIIYDDGEVLYERYFDGNDEILGKNVGIVSHSESTLHDVRSITKSVVSTCVGIAIDQGLISGADQKISSFFPEFDTLFTGKKKEWTIHNFLTMSTGLQWNEDVPYTDPANDETIMMFNDTPIEYVLSRPLIHDPGTVFNYSGGATQILLEIVERASGMSIYDFAGTHLFKKIGIDRFEWSKFEKSDVFAGPSGLRLTTRGLLDYALLYHNKGTWEGTQVVSETWVNSSFSKHAEFPSDVLDWNEYYGYQFWIWHDEIDGRRANIVSANGNGDQNIFWIDSDLIVITTAGNYNNWEIEHEAYYMLTHDIYSVLR